MRTVEPQLSELINGIENSSHKCKVDKKLRRSCFFLRGVRNGYIQTVKLRVESPSITFYKTKRVKPRSTPTYAQRQRATNLHQQLRII